MPNRIQVGSAIFESSIFLDYRPGISATNDVQRENMAHFCEECATQVESLDIPVSEMIKGFKTREDYYKMPERIVLGPE